MNVSATYRGKAVPFPPGPKFSTIPCTFSSDGSLSCKLVAPGSSHCQFILSFPDFSSLLRVLGKCSSWVYLLQWIHDYHLLPVPCRCHCAHRSSGTTPLSWFLSFWQTLWKHYNIEGVHQQGTKKFKQVSILSVFASMAVYLAVRGWIRTTILFPERPWIVFWKNGCGWKRHTCDCHWAERCRLTWRRCALYYICFCSFPEANLDIQWMAAIAPKVEMVFWSIKANSTLEIDDILTWAYAIGSPSDHCFVLTTQATWPTPLLWILSLMGWLLVMLISTFLPLILSFFLTKKISWSRLSQTLRRRISEACLDGPHSYHCWRW